MPVQHDGHGGLSLDGEALHTTVHGGVKVWVVVVTAVRARARAGSAWQACRGVLAVRRNTAAKEDDAWMSRNSSVPSPSAPD